jgi:mRNA interferase RelE/StbE
MEIKVTYHHLVIEKDIPKLDNSTREKIKKSIEQKLMVAPTIFGVPMRGSLKRNWKLRVLDWRIVYKIVGMEVRIFVIEHRSVVYDILLKRI